MKKEGRRTMIQPIDVKPVGIGMSGRGVQGPSGVVGPQGQGFQQVTQGQVVVGGVLRMPIQPHPPQPHVLPPPQPNPYIQVNNPPVPRPQPPEEPKTLCDGRFTILSVLGEGSYGKVYKAYDTLRKEIMAVKKVKFHSSTNQGIPQSSLRELAILKEIHHENIVRLEDILGNRDGTRELYLVFHLAEGDLRRYQHNHKYRLSKDQIKKIFHGLVQGVDYLHRQRIVHRDLKPENVLVNTKGEKGLVVQVADFGLSRTIHMPLRPYSREILSMWYRAPEVCMGYKNYSIGVDTWALGCILYELITGQPLFKGKTDSEMLYKIFETFGTPSGDKWAWVRKIAGFSDKYPHFPGKGIRNTLFAYEVVREDPAVVDLIEKFLQLDPMERISCADALLHPYFS